MLKYFFGLIQYLPQKRGVTHSQPTSLSGVINMVIVMMIIMVNIFITYFHQIYTDVFSLIYGPDLVTYTYKHIHIYINIK